MNIAIQETEDPREESAVLKDGTVFLHLTARSEWALLDLIIRRALSGVCGQSRKRAAREIETILRRNGLQVRGDMKESVKLCEQCKQATAFMNSTCGVHVCNNCGHHNGLVRCYCGWAADGGNGLRQLQEMGETIEPEE